MKDRLILIVGFTRRTSFSAAKVLLEMGNRVVISDTVDDPEKQSLVQELNAYGEVISLLGDQSPQILDKYAVDLILPSPGVPLNIPLIETARSRGIEVIGDIELFYRFHPGLTYVAITGTDGKTTTTTLTYEILKREKNAVVGGNIGTPVFELHHLVKEDSVVVLELSSFQLEEIRDFHPQVAALLNIAADHLDRYASLEEYRDAKARLFMNQTSSDIAVLNRDSLYTDYVASHISPRPQTFSRRESGSDMYFDGQWLYYRGEKYIERKDIRLTGVHNVENAMAAILMAKSLGVSDRAIREVLGEFAGLPHRLEFIRELDGVKYYNDSKATTVNSIEKALLSFDKPIVLIAGGRDKGLDFSLLRELVREKVKALVLIGEAAEKINRSLDFQPAVFAQDLADAIGKSRELAHSGEVVLLSPGCTSFDMFKNYTERGERFREIVLSL